MSNTTENQTENFLHVSYDLSKIFIWSNRFSKLTFKNNTGGIASFAPGLVVAIDSSDGTLVPFDDDTAANGDDQPVGILASTITDLAIAGTVTDIDYCDQGDVAEEKVTFQDGDTLATVVTGGQTVRQVLKNAGIRLVPRKELSGADNS